jgi:hypothetical protein
VLEELVVKHKGAREKIYNEVGMCQLTGRRAIAAIGTGNVREKPTKATSIELFRL